MDFWVTRSCKTCGYEETIELAKMDAAFHLYDSAALWKKECPACKSTECKSVSYPLVKLDKQLLDIWGNNLQLTLMEQDEELLLAEVEYLPMILQAIDEKQYLPAKINTLLEALCVLLYDNLANSFEYSPKENLLRAHIVNRVKPELVKRKDLIRGASQSISDYIKEVVFPEIELEE